MGSLDWAELKVLNDGHTKTIYSIAVSADSTCIVSGSDDNSVWVWDALTGVELEMSNGHTNGISSVAFSSDGTGIISGSYDNSMWV